MKIAQIAPLYESVPPRYYGGTERVVYHLTEELVRMGHDVTLYASGDSLTSARLVPLGSQALRLDSSCIDQIVHHVLMVERVYRAAEQYDIIHSHIDYFPFSMVRRVRTPVVTTLHGRLDLKDLVPLYMDFADVPLVSISNAQRDPLPWVNWLDTVYHGIPAQSYQPYEQPGTYLAFLGRISPEKRVDRAIEIAKRANLPLKIAAKVSIPDREYFTSTIEPLMSHPLIEYRGEIGEKDKNEFLGNAAALIFPIDWPEPFGLVMIEALACGTPVIARAHGSVPEIIEHGVNGFIVQNEDEAVEAVKALPGISRKKCREIFEERFTARRMARDYVTVYRKLISSSRHLKQPASSGVHGRDYSDTR